MVSNPYLYPVVYTPKYCRKLWTAGSMLGGGLGTRHFLKPTIKIVVETSIQCQRERPKVVGEGEGGKRIKIDTFYNIR